MEYYQNDSASFEKKREQRRKKRRKKQLKTFFIVFLLMLLSVGVILSLTVLFPIKEITVSGNTVYDAAEIINESGLKVGENMFVSGGLNLGKRITENLPYIKKVKIKREFSGKITIEVTATTEKCCYLSNGEYYLCDHDNEVLEILASNDKGVPEIRLCGGVTGSLGQRIVLEEEDEQLSQSTYSSLINKGIQPQIIDISDPLNIKVLVENRLVLIFGTKTEFDGKVNHFKGMYKKMSPDVSGIVTLSAWTPEKLEAYFKEYDVKNYFNNSYEVDTVPSNTASSQIVSDVSSDSTSDASGVSSVVSKSQNSSVQKK